MGSISARTLFTGLSFALMMAALSLIFLYVPTEATMGMVQRIFYIHVPVCWVALVAFLVVFVGSILFLWRRENKWDAVACSSAEIGLIFTTLALVTGSIWAKASWGVWWTWDARLTSTLVLWFIYLAYFIVRTSATDDFIVRTSATDELRGSRFAAVTAIVGFIDMPICILAIILWRTQHPEPVIFQGGLTAPMLITLLTTLAAFSALYFLLLIMRVSLINDESEIKKLKELYQ